MNSRCVILFAIFAAGLFRALNAFAAEPPPATSQKIDFATDVEPIFSKHCYSCHGPDKQENDLRLDVASVALKGGSSGPVITPKNGAGSKLIRMLDGTEKPRMPKKGDPLTLKQIAVLRTWIDQGAPWPEPDGAKGTGDKADWWSFKTAPRPDLPPVNSAARNEIDLFIHAKLKDHGLSPSREANRATLLRRLTFNLHGLPPTPEQLAQVTSDEDPGWYEKLVDDLLASPRYGERWARHWLDTIHYGETHGYDKDKPRPNAWPYRDYVIRSLNADKAYWRFVQEQLAGDVLYPDEPDGIVALGFIAAGPWDFVGHVELPIEKTDGLIARYNDRDDMVMTTMSTFQSLTVHCARCHNHKFDPISQKDYYNLQSVFAGVDRADRPFDPDKTVHIKRRSLALEKSALETRFQTLSNEVARLSSTELEEIAAELQRVNASLTQIDPTEKSQSNGYHSGIEKRPDIEKWVQVDLGTQQTIGQVDLVPAHPTDFRDTPGFGFPPRFTVQISDVPDFSRSEIIADLTGGDFEVPLGKPFTIVVNSQKARYVRVTAKKLWERTDDFVFALAELQVFSSGTNVAFQKEVTALDSIEAGLWSKKFLVDGYSSRTRLKNTLTTPAERLKKEQLRKEQRKLEQKHKSTLDALIGKQRGLELAALTNRLHVISTELASLPQRHTVYAAATDFEPNGHFTPSKGIRPVHVLTRGDVKRPGEAARPAALGCVPGPNHAFVVATNEASRRAALAQWITDGKNLLTRRSIVNRVWHYHFGRGIVETPNDFGHMGALPTHPELLDWLAYWFMENGESLKKLHRLILTSATYRQTSEHNAEASRVDSSNRLLWRMNRARLDAETIRDSMLFVSGRLDLTTGGPSMQQFHFRDDHSPVYDYTRFDFDTSAANRRSIYRFIVRSVPDPFMDSLDCPDASLLTPVRNTSITALQALAVLNDPFVIKQSRHLATRLEKISNDPGEQVQAAIQLALNRKPSDGELAHLVSFTQKHSLPNTCRVVFNMAEFMFVD